MGRHGVGVDDQWELQRFIDAQDGAGSFDSAVRELSDGRKVSHWMWFVFPQVAGLGTSAMARRFAVSGVPEAVAYLGHPVLGPRLSRCAGLLVALPGDDAVAVLGAVDARKLQSSMTLFARAAADLPAPDLPAADGEIFGQVLDKYFAGRQDAATIDRI